MPHFLTGFEFLLTTVLIAIERIIAKISEAFPVKPLYVMQPQLQITSFYIAYHYVKI